MAGETALLKIFKRKVVLEDGITTGQVIKMFQSEFRLSMQSFNTQIKDLYDTREQVLKEIREIKDELQRLKKD